MKLLPIILLAISITSCQEQIKVSTTSSAFEKKDEIVPVVNLLVATQENITLKGKFLAGVTGVRFTYEKKAPVKDFKIISRAFDKLVIESIDLTPLPVDIALTMILDNAFGQHKFPVLFSLQDDAVKTRHITDGNVTRLKLGKEELDEPKDGEILKWDNSTGTFVFAPDNTGENGGDGTVTNIGLGNGIVGDGSAITTTGDVAVDVGVTGDPSLTKIPFFNSKNQLVLDNKDSSFNPTQLIFSGGPEYSITNGGGLIIKNETEGLELLNIGAQGEVAVPGNLTVGGKQVCLEDGTDCPSIGGPGGIEKITVTAPILGGGEGPIVNVAIDVGTGPNQVVQLDANGALPAVDGSKLIGVVKGPPTSNFGEVAIFSGKNGENVLGTKYRIPQRDGSFGQILVTDGTGNVTWQQIGGGVGDVVGPEGAISEHIATYDGATGKKIKDSGVKVSDLGDVKGSNSSVVNGIAIHSDTTGKLIKSTPYSIPDADGALGQVLANDGNGKAIWSTIPQGGDVVGPDKAKITGVAIFNASNGKSIASTYYGLPVMDGEPGQVLATNGMGKARWTTIQGGGGGGDVFGPASSLDGNLPSYNDATGKIINDSGVAAQLVLDNQTNIVSLQASNTEFNTRITNNENNITLIQTDVANHRQVPQDDGLGPKVLISTGINTSKWIPDGNFGQVLTTDGVGNVSWQSTATGGDVSGPNMSVDGSIASYNGVTGKLIKDSGVPAQLVLDNQLNIGGIQASLTDYSLRISNNEMNITNLQTEVASHLQVPTDAGNAGRILASSGDDKSTWLADGTIGQVLSTDGAGVLSWKDVSSTGGDVVGPASSTDFNLAAFDGATGKLIKDTGFNASDLLRSVTPSANTTNKMAVFQSSDSKILKAAPYTVPTDLGLDGQVLTSDGNGLSQWEFHPAGGDVSGPGSSVDSNLALFDGVTGKLIKDSGVGVGDFGDVKGPNSSIAGNVASYNDVTGKLINDSGVPAQLILDNQIDIGGISATLTNFDTRITNNENNITNNTNSIVALQTEVASHLQVPTDSGSAGRILTSSGDNNSTWLVDGTNGQFLSTDGAGVVSWQSIAAGGDVSGPASSIQFNLASYNDATGKIINDSGVAASLVLDNQTNIAAVAGTLTSFDTRITNNENNITNNTTSIVALQTEVASHLQVPTDAGAGGRILTSSGDDNSAWLADGTIGQFLSTDGAGVVSWQSIPAGGDVVGPNSSIAGNITSYDGITGKLINDSGVPAQLVLDNQLNIGGISATLTNFDTRISNNETNIINLETEVASHLEVPDDASNAGRILASSGNNNSTWLADGTNGQFLSTDGAGAISWKNVPAGGDVNGPDSSILGNIASYNDITGKVINDSGVAASLVLDNQNNIGGIQATLTDYDLRISTNETNITNLETEVASHLQVPTDAGNAGRILASSGDDKSTWLADGSIGQVLTTDGAGVISWTDIPAGGDVVGPVSSTGDAIPLYDGATGKLIKNSNLTYNGVTLTGAEKIDSGVFRMLSGSNMVTLGSSPSLAVPYDLRFPAVAPDVNQILQSDGAGNFSWINTPISSGGDVVGPATSTDFNIALFDGNNGKIIKDSGVNINDLGDVVGPETSLDNQVALYDGGTGKKIKSTEYKLPVADGNAGEVLTSDGNGNVNFRPAPGGGVGGSISICQIEMRLKKGEELSIESGKNDLRWDSDGPYGGDCSWITYGSTTEDGDYKSGGYFTRFDLQAGNYMVDGWVSFRECGESWIGLANDTDGVEIKQGMTANSKVGEISPTTYVLKTPFSLGDQKTLKVRFAAEESDCHTTKGNKYGNPHELAGQIVIWKFN